jgi:murein DD-endopeptidase MepM/ murein hydrolase activator NlpD
MQRACRGAYFIVPITYCEATPMTKQVIYWIESSKFEAGFIFCLVITALLLPLVSALQQTHATQALHAASFYGGFSGPISESIHPQPITSPATSAQPATLAGRISADAMWPIHGRVTTQFGEPHQPWQPTHTGIDITSARAAGATPVSPFRAGTVTKVVHSYSGLGNHVSVDHGGGIVSIYGHLFSTQVLVGQTVRPGDTLGTEGSTGASTGTHLHFEIQVNGTPVNPRNYLAGSP